MEVRVDVDDERRANSREQTRLWEQVRYLVGTDDERRTNIKVVLRSSSYFLLNIVRIVFGGLPLVHRVEVEVGIIGLDGLEERPESLGSYVQSAVRVQTSAAHRTYHLGSIYSGGDTFSPFQHRP